MKSPFHLAAQELRANPRYSTASVIVVTNLTQATPPVNGLLVDISTTGMRIEANLPFRTGDAVRVDLQNFMLLAEVVHYTEPPQRSEVGLKLIHSLAREHLARFVQPPWAELV